MCVTHAVKIAKCVLNIRIDPCIAPVVARFCASGDHLRKGTIRRHDKPFLSDHLCQRLRQAKSFKRQNRPLLGFYPECIRIITRI
jgi:hypothetical protein